MTAAMMVALLIADGLRERGRVAYLLAGIVGLAFIKPVVGLVVIVGLWLGRFYRRLRLARSAKADAAQEVGVLARLLLVGLSAGLPLQSALTHAHRELRDGLAGDVAGVLKRSRVAGLAAALASVTGPGSRLFSLVAGSVVSGASVAPVLVGFLHERAADEKAALGQLDDPSEEVLQQREQMLGKRHNAAVEEMEIVAAEFNNAVRAYKANAE